MFIRHGGKGGGVVWRWGRGRLYTYRYTVTTSVTLKERRWGGGISMSRTAGWTNDGEEQTDVLEAAPLLVSNSTSWDEPLLETQTPATDSTIGETRTTNPDLNLSQNRSRAQRRVPSHSDIEDKIKVHWRSWTGRQLQRLQHRILPSRNQNPRQTPLLPQQTTDDSNRNQDTW